MRHLASIGLCILSLTGLAQTVGFRGNVTDQNDAPLFGVVVHVDGITESFLTDDKGKYLIRGLAPGPVRLTFFQPGFRKVEHTIDSKNGMQTLDVRLEPLSKEMEAVTVSGTRDEDGVMTALRAVEGMTINAGRKTEVVQMDRLNGNLASNRARQVFSHVAGLNIWESDCAGIQIGVGGRGLSPNRTENFNTRQNGYDIAADALGYPESYYSPPMLAIKRVEVVRGAASLQFGPQFGGMLNFVMKDGADSSRIEVESVQSIGSYGFFNSYNALGGSVGRFKYYTFLQYRFGNCWRCNSEFDNYTAYAALSYSLAKATTLKTEYTRMWYLAQQGGGLTDAQFAENAQASHRDRNWFRVRWNVMALSMRHGFSCMAKLDVRLFGLLASREALGFLAPPNLSDPIDNPATSDLDRYRDLISGKFNNIGAEIRFMQRYNILDRPQIFLTGIRLYKGLTHTRQAAADSTYGPVFEFADVDDNASASRHPSANVAWFAEHIFNIRSNFSITPGVRVEYIDTQTEGESRSVYRDQADNVILDSLLAGGSRRQRWFPLFGIGLSYRPLRGMELYANISQNYKPINFNDLWVSNPSYRIDPDMKDETGFNADLGLRGRIGNVLRFDITAFVMLYSDRIGFVQQTDPELFSVYRLRTNVADARTLGLETYLRWNMVQTFRPGSSWKAAIFSNVTLLDARYIASEESAFRNREVELTPRVLARTGLDVSFKGISISYLFSFTDRQFTDATNAVSTGNAVNGIVPAYHVMDLNLSYRFRKMTFSGGIGNLTDNRYFTRRATGYPGPGIIPSSGRTFFLTIGIKV